VNPTFIDTSSLQYAPWQAFVSFITPNPQVAPGSFRPPGWDSAEGGSINAGPNTFIELEGEYYFFDAVMRLDHNQSQRITQHPVQTGANITDHSFSLPAQLTMEIGMSDVMDNYKIDQWGSDTSEPTKSVHAYLTLVDWKNKGKPLKITTRMDIYENMVIATISAPDDVKTVHGVRCVVTFQQIFTASIEKRKTSALPSKTDLNKKGSVPTQDLGRDNMSGPMRLLPSTGGIN
jgi:hypothetical protein